MQKLFVFIGLTILSLGSARVVRDAPTAEFSFENLFKQSQQKLQEFEKSVLESLGASSPDDIKKIVQKHGETLAKHLDVLADNVKKDTEDLQNLPAVKELRESVEKNVEEFKNKHPETTAQLEEFIEKTKQDAADVVAKVKALSESPEAENLKHLSQKLVESVGDAFKDLVKTMVVTENKQ